MLAQNEALIYKAEKYRFINFATVYYNENSATQTIKFFDRYNLIIVRSTYSLRLSGGKPGRLSDVNATTPEKTIN